LCLTEQAFSGAFSFSGRRFPPSFIPSFQGTGLYAGMVPTFAFPVLTSATPPCPQPRHRDFLLHCVAYLFVCWEPAEVFLFRLVSYAPHLPFFCFLSEFSSGPPVLTRVPPLLSPDHSLPSSKSPKNFSGLVPWLPSFCGPISNFPFSWRPG